MKYTGFFAYALAIIFILVVIYFTLFYRLDANPIYRWDEARLAVNALEMSQSHNYLIPTYEGVPDMWNVKPPLMIIIQSFSMKVFGYNELGARLPTAVAAFATMCLLFWFAVAILKNFIAGCCAVLFLCTSSGYVCMHVARTGDYDTLLIFFLTAYFIYGLAFLITKKYKFYLLFNVFLLLALLTKGIAGIFFLPGLFLLYILYKDHRRDTLNLNFLLPPLFVFSCFLSYYLIREVYNPGYVHTVIFEEIQGRLFDSRFDTESKWYYFFEEMVTSTFRVWWILLPFSILVYGHADKIERKVILGIFLTLIIFWIPLTISINKNYWYFAPSFPLLSLLVALSFSKICLTLTEQIRIKEYRILLISSPIILLMILPFKNVYDSSSELNLQIGLAELVKSKRIQTGTKIISKGYNSPVVFYQKALKLRGTNIEVIPIRKIKEGDTVIVLSTNDANEVKQRFQCSILYTRQETEMLFLKTKS